MPDIEPTGAMGRPDGTPSADALAVSPGRIVRRDAEIATELRALVSRLHLLSIDQIDTTAALEVIEDELEALAFRLTQWEQP